jgi:hypothetical protein
MAATRFSPYVEKDEKDKDREKRLLKQRLARAKKKRAVKLAIRREEAKEQALRHPEFMSDLERL